MHTDDTNDVIAFALVQDMSRIIQLKPCCFEVVRLDIRISDLRRPQCDPDLASRIQGQSRERAVRNSTYMKPMLERIETLAGAAMSEAAVKCQPKKIMAQAVVLNRTADGPVPSCVMIFHRLLPRAELCLSVSETLILDVLTPSRGG
jgi:hypothetical protein